MLCDRCDAFDIQAFKRDGFMYRGYPLEAVLDSVDKGCSFCTLLLEYLRLADNGNEYTYLSMAMRKRRGESLAIPWFSRRQLRLAKIWLQMVTVPVWVHFQVWRGGEGDDQQQQPQPLSIRQLGAFVSGTRQLDRGCSHTPTVWFNVAADLGTPAQISQDIIGHLAIENHTWSLANIEAIKKWHNSCRWWHPQCKKTLSRCGADLDAEKSPLPSRCLEVRSGCDQAQCSNCPLYFILRETGGQEGKYIALSHRWADETATVRTLKENYAYRLANWGQQHRNEGPFWITQLFCEAGHLALRLGINYIWIDSLCIVQDDSDDWDRESVRMADYYQQAWLTIAATTTSRAGGLFSEVNTEELPRVTRLPYRDRSGEQKGHFYVQCSGDAMVAKEYRTSVTNSELLQRGWVYQEWILSRRLVTFSNSGLFLTCQGGPPQTTLGDNVQKSNTDEGGGDKRDGHTDKSFKKDLVTNDFSAVRGILRAWEKLVESYSGLQLTKIDRDRIVALAGVASEYGKALRERERESSQKTAGQKEKHHLYASGTWFPHIRSLLWERVRRCPTERIGGIPTWSWASMKTFDQETGKYGGVEVQWSSAWGGTKIKQVCRLEDATVVPVMNVDKEADIWLPDFDRAGEEQEALQGDVMYENSRRFFILSLSGCLHTVQIHGYFDDEDDTKVAAKLTSHRENFGRDTWRKVTIDEISPSVVIGWASVEHPDCQIDGPLDEDHDARPLYALFISSFENVDEGFAVGNLVTAHLTAYKVVYLRKAEVSGFENAYERVGVGRLFGNEVATLFNTLEEEKISLV